jgi:hypothetical protein
MHRRGADRWLHLAVAAAIAAALAHIMPVASQETGNATPSEDLTLPPRLDGATAARASRLAEPPAAAPEDPIEEVIVVREEKWRLPDLGSEWRARAAERAAASDRIHVELFPLFDPERLPPERNLFLINSEMRRVGYIEIFRLRFGRR